MQLRRRQFLNLAAAAVTVPAVSRSAWAQTYPMRPVRIIVGFAAGNTPDIVARLIGTAQAQEAAPAAAAGRARRDVSADPTVDQTGRSLSHRTYVVRGTSGNPMDAKEVEAKALDLIAPVLGPVAGLRPLLQA